ncbi:MAG: hypothetical protein ABI169_15670 [Chitinophagaceae bacterium]
MTLFRLRSQHSGQTKDFTLLDVLNALGDTVNDEIRFPDGNREDVYNLSSFQDLSSGGNGGDLLPITSGGTKLVNEALPITNGQQAINLGASPLSLCLIFLNGLKLRQGIDYNKSGRTLMFLTPLKVSVSHTDQLEALYDIPA